MTSMWLRVGGRGIDTAAAYDNQPDVGAAIKAAIASGEVKRSDIFVTTKITTLSLQSRSAGLRNQCARDSFSNCIISFGYAFAKEQRIGCFPPKCGLIHRGTPYSSLHLLLIAQQCAHYTPWSKGAVHIGIACLVSGPN